MSNLGKFVSVALFLVQIAPIANMAKTTHQSRVIRSPRVPYEPCRNQEIGKFVKDRYACDRFFYCAPGEKAISVECPTGMIFNDEKEICDFQWNYLCIAEIEEVEDLMVTTTEGQEIQTPIATTPKPAGSKDDRCPIDDGQGLVFLPNTNECHRYYICYRGYPIPQECIPELHWNPKMKRCDFPENAGCLVRSSTPSTTAAPIVGVTVNCPFRGEQILPHPEHCNYFIYCVNGFATVQQCPFFHHYDVQSKSCMWQTMAKCIVSKEARKP